MTDSMGNMAMVRNISLMMTDAEGSTGGSGDTGGSACAGEVIIVVLFIGTIYYSRKAVCGLIKWASDYVIDSLASKDQAVAQTQLVAGSTPASPPPPPGNNHNDNKQRNGTPKNNRAQNEQVNSIARKLKLTDFQREQLHREIHGQNLSYQEILEIARCIRGEFTK